jgi:hypothetical protein
MVKGTNEMTSFSTLARAARLGSTRKRGVTLIEAVLYISIALALIVGGLVFFQQASLAQRTNSAVRNISAIASETRGLYQAQSDFNGFTHAALVNAGAVPTSLINAAGDIKNEWGGTVTAGATALLAPFAANSGFWVEYPNVPTAACVRLTSADVSGSGRVGSGIRAVTFGTTRIAAASSANPPVEQLNPSQVSTACTNAAVNGVVTVRFDFNR